METEPLHVFVFQLVLIHLLILALRRRRHLVSNASPAHCSACVTIFREEGQEDSLIEPHQTTI